MKLYDFGLQYLEKNAPQFQITDPDIGVVTATDHNTFVGVQTLYLSLKNKINFICYDIGMTSEDLKWCADNNLKTVKFDYNISHIDKWQTFLKPFIVKCSPYSYTLWMDSDCIVTGNLSASNVILNKNTFFTKHWISKNRVRKNNKKIYELYPVEGDSEFINAGVFGIDKTKHLKILDYWTELVNIALQDETGSIRSYLAMHDEGALLWAIRKTNNGHLVIDEDGKYNFYCDINGKTDQIQQIYSDFFCRKIGKINNCITPSAFFKSCLQQSAYVCHLSTCMENDIKYWKLWT